MIRENSVFVTKKLIKKLGIPVTSKTIIEELDVHPNFSSLFAISDILDKLNVPNIAFSVQADELYKIPCPFIVHISLHGGKFALLNYIDKEKAIITNEQFTNHVISFREFTNAYIGTVLVAEKAVGSGELDYRKRRLNEIADNIRLPFIISSLLLILISLFLNTVFTDNVSLGFSILMLSKSVGLVISILLLVQSIDSTSPFAQRFCLQAKSFDCNNILLSPAAKVNNILNWAEVGFFYFAGTLLVLLVSNSSSWMMLVLGVLNLLALPYTFYSIYYQARVAKKWCLLCCIVQCILWVEFFSFSVNIFQPVPKPGFDEISMLFTGIIIPVVLWVLLKPYFLHFKQVGSLRQQLHKFKYNADLFKKLLVDQPMHLIPDEAHSIVFGNRNAAHIITVVSNPYCQPCSRVHRVLEQWLENRDDIRFQIIFSPHNEKDAASIVAGHFLSLKSTKDDILIKKALCDWYYQHNKDYEDWASRYPVNEITGAEEILRKQREWCKSTNVKFTPAIFIDGRMLPSFYEAEDLRYLI